MERATQNLVQNASTKSLVRATAAVDSESETLTVILDDGTPLNALVLHSGGPMQISDGARVLLLMPEQDDEMPLVLGCITDYASAARPERLCLEASKSVSLKCGDGSVTLRNDNVLVKGKEVVSRSKGANQIKGGSVSIN